MKERTSRYCIFICAPVSSLVIEGEEVSPGAGQIHLGVGEQTLGLVQQRRAHTPTLEAGGHCQGAWQRNNKLTYIK